MAMTPEERKARKSAYEREYERRRKAEDPEYLERYRERGRKHMAERRANDPEYVARENARRRADHARKKAERTNP